MPKFSKRHYEVIADVLSAEKPGEHWDGNKHVQHNQTVKAFLRALGRDNPKFRYDTFLKRAGGFVGKDAELRTAID